MNTNSFLVHETGVRAAMLVDEVQGVAREVVGKTAGFAFDEVGVLVPCRRCVSESSDRERRRQEIVVVLRAISQIKSDDMFERSAILKRL